MYGRRGSEPSSSIDWLPWGLSIFGACCAVFVLVKGVLPERSANRDLVQQLARLETDLTRAQQEAREELSRAQAELAQRALAARAEVDAAREQERLRAAKEAARRDLGQSLATQIKAGDVVVSERGGDLVLSVRDRLLFSGNSSRIEPKGRRFLRELAASIQRLPPEQVYRIGGKSERQQRAVLRYLQYAGRVPQEQLATVGAAAPDNAPPQPGSLEIVFMLRAH